MAPGLGMCTAGRVVADCGDTASIAERSLFMSLWLAHGDCRRVLLRLSLPILSVSVMERTQISWAVQSSASQAELRRTVLRPADLAS